jgi:lipoprotein LprG
MTTRPRARPAVATTLLAVLALSACGGGGGDKMSPADALAAAKQHLDDTSGVHIALATDKLPAGVNGLLAADGVATHAPAFKGSIKVAASGVTADAAVVAVNGTVYAKLPFTTKFVQIDPKDYSAPDPAALMDTEGGLSSLLTSAENVTEGGQQRDGDVVLSTYQATVPGKAVTKVIPSASPKADFDATFTLTGDQLLHQAILTGPFYPKAGQVTYTISFDKYGTKQDISAP